MHYEERDAWIKAQLTQWQTEWHDAFDQCPVYSVSGEGDRPDSLSSIGDDFRLIYGFWATSEATRARCFSVFPNGTEMHRRFEEGFAERFSGPDVDEPEAKEIFRELSDLVDEARPKRAVPFSEASNASLDEIRSTESVRWLFDKKLPLDPRPLLPGLATRIFLSNPLYAVGGNHYEPGDWITAATREPATDRVFAAVYRLWKSGWQVRVGSSVILIDCRSS